MAVRWWRRRGSGWQRSIAIWWESVLHNQTARRLKAALLFRPGIVVTNVPYHLVR